MSKNYIGFVNDHSGSMCGLAEAAIKDYNANIKAIKEAATKEMLDTVVSVSEVGAISRLSVTVSNPHVLKEKTEWVAAGGTPLWSGTANLIKMLTALPDANKPDVSFLVLITTDGEATDGRNFPTLQALMRPLLATGRWTFVARVPKGINATTGAKFYELGIPQGNIQFWETTVEGMATSTAQTTTAMANYFTGRSAGNRSTGAFYADASQVNVAAPAPVQLPAVPVSTKPTKSPIPKTPKVNQVFFETREDARIHCRNQGISQTLIKDHGRDAANGRRWAIQA